MTQTFGAYLDCLFWIGFGTFMLFGTRFFLRPDRNPEEFTRRQKLIKIGGAVLMVVGFLQLALRYFS